MYLPTIVCMLPPSSQQIIACSLIQPGAYKRRKLLIQLMGTINAWWLIESASCKIEYYLVSYGILSVYDVITLAFSIEQAVSRCIMQ